MAGFCEHYSGPLVSMKCGEFDEFEELLASGEGLCSKEIVGYM